MPPERVVEVPAEVAASDACWARTGARSGTWPRTRLRVGIYIGPAGVSPIDCHGCSPERPLRSASCPILPEVKRQEIIRTVRVTADLWNRGPQPVSNLSECLT